MIGCNSRHSWTAIGGIAMNKWFWVLVICGSAIIVSGLFLIFAILKERKRRKNFGSVWTTGQNTKRATPPKLLIFYQKSYMFLLRVPITRGQILRIRKRLTAINTYDEYTLRKETMRITYFTLGSALLGILILAVVSRSWMAVFFGVLIAIIMNELFVDIFVNRVEDRLLKQFSRFLEDNRHYYQEVRMVDEAIYQAAQASPQEIKLQVEKIYDILTSHEPHKGLEGYYAVAPNRYLKVFAGISHLIMEYGDRTVDKGSMYLNSINKLVQEIRYDLLRRQRLRYRLGGLTMIAIAPILLSFPLVRWAESYFPITKDFYTSKMGIIIRLVIYGVSALSYVLIRKLSENDEAKYVPKGPRKQWEKQAYNWPIVRWFVDRLVPGAQTRKHYRLNMLLKEANSPFILEWFYIHRLAVSIAGFVGVVILAVVLHITAVFHVYNSPTKEQTTILGYMNETELSRAEELTKFDNQIIREVKAKGQKNRESIKTVIEQNSDKPLSDVDMNSAIMRIEGKMALINNEFFKWWELLIAIAAGGAGYYLPVWILQFQRKLRAMEMQNEVDQFHVLISILSEFERMSVETILEWMERYGIIFRPALQRALLTFDSGSEAALKTLMDEAPFESFVRIIKRLHQAIEKISIREAFDDLEMEQEYYAEQKKERLERLIRQKASWGRMIGWTPGALLIGLYLVFPFLYMSFGQLGELSKQIQTI